MNKVCFFIIVFAVLLCSCKKESKYPGYTEGERGVYYKLLSFKDSNKKPSEGDHLEIHMVGKTMNDSILFDSRTVSSSGAVMINFKKDSLEKKWAEILSGLNEGDSVSFVVNSEMVFGLLPDISDLNDPVEGEMKLDICIAKMMNPVEYAQWQSVLLKKKEDMDIEEQRELKVYLTSQSVDEHPIGAGIYYMPLVEGSGTPVEVDKNIEVSYKGSFLNGRTFDSTKTGQPFQFTFGDEFQLIRGLEEGISLMKEGGKAKFIIPSQLAFGDKGSSTGIVPPYTTVVYEVEVLKVN